MYASIGVYGNKAEYQKKASAPVFRTGNVVILQDSGRNFVGIHCEYSCLILLHTSEEGVMKDPSRLHN